MSERGMKKWAPYKSLIEQEKYLKKASDNNEKQVRPQISSDEAEIINEKLVNYSGEEYTFYYYKTGRILKEKSTIKKIDIYNRKIILSNGVIIYLKDLVGIK